LFSKKLHEYDVGMNILVRMPNWIGDLVMATPVLSDLRTQFPDASITVMCRKPLSDLLIQDPNVNEVFSFSRPSNRFLRRQEDRNIVEKIRAGKFDVGVLLTNSFSSAWLFWQGKVKRRIGFSMHWRRLLLSDALPKPTKGLEHEVYTYKKLLAPLGVPRLPSEPKIYLEAKEVDSAMTLIENRGFIKGSPLIGINVGAAYGSAKCWPADRFQAVAQKLLEDPTVFLLFFGDAGTSSLVKEICQGLPKRAMNVAGVTTLRELACLIQECSVLLTNDSGPMHVGAALGTPLVALFGSTDDRATGPFGQAESVIHKRPSCSPCFKRECPIDFRCMKQISVEEVVGKVVNQLRNSRRV
jgi:heptosyltransferase-2